MLKFAAATCVLIGSLITLSSSTVIPGASTPLFYLVSSTPTNSAVNLLPLRFKSGPGGTTTLSGGGNIGQFYFFQGKFVALDATQSSSLQANIAEAPVSGGCSGFGQLEFTGTTSDKCAQFNTFSIQSDTENSQLGANLVFNNVGGFFACGSTNDVYYLTTPANGPPGLTCSPIKLDTVPV